MSETRSRMVIFLGLVLLAAAPVLGVQAAVESGGAPSIEEGAQGFEDPRMLIDQLSAAVTRGDMRGVFRLFDPEALRPFRQMIVALESAGLVGEKAAQMFRVLRIQRWEQLESLSTVEILGRIVDSQLSESPEAAQMFSASRFEVLGSVEEKPDLLHFVVRGEVRVGEVDLSQMVVQSARRTSTGWLAIPSGDLDAWLQAMKLSFGGAAEAHKTAPDLAQDEALPEPSPASPPIIDPIIVDASMTPPRRIEKVNPRYPEGARADRVEGSAVLQAVIDAEGHVIDVRVLRTSGDERLDASAIVAVRQWRYEPALHDGKPVAVLFTVVVEFNLQQDDTGKK